MAVPVSVVLAVTTPVDPTTLALLLDMLHEPPPGRSLSVVTLPGHKDIVPVIAPGCGLTVTIVVVLQPVPLIA